MSSGKAHCDNCGTLIKLEPCEAGSTGYNPTECPKCGEEFELDYPAIPEEE